VYGVLEYSLWFFQNSVLLMSNCAVITGFMNSEHSVADVKFRH